jgi:TPR repeat protein
MEFAMTDEPEIAESELMFWRGVILIDEGERERGIELFRQSAELGNGKAMSQLGAQIYLSGDIEAATPWLRKAVAAGEPSGWHNLAAIAGGQGELDEEFALLTRAADAGFAPAMSRLAELSGAKGDNSAEFMWNERAADAGHPGARLNMAKMRRHQGDTEGHRRLLEQAADDGDAVAMNSLGVLAYKEGDAVSAEHWFERAMQLAYPGAANNLGVIRRDAGETESAQELFTIASEQGDANAASSLAVMQLANGDEILAFRTLRPFWILGEPLATKNMESLLRGHHERASSSAEAMNDLGVVLAELDREEEAEEWFKRAAAEGDSFGMYNVARQAERRGRTTEARAWYQKARDAGFPSMRTSDLVNADQRRFEHLRRTHAYIDESVRSWELDRSSDTDRANRIATALLGTHALHERLVAAIQASKASGDAAGLGEVLESTGYLRLRSVYVSILEGQRFDDNHGSP